MHDLLHRLALVLLAGCGLAAIATPLAPNDLPLPAQLLLAATGAGLLAALVRPAIRPVALAAALTARLSLLALALPLPAAHELLKLVLLAAAGAILADQARRDARWNMGRRQEG